jgi:biopolymer transport protein ExbD
MKFSRRRPDEPEINLIPFIDVLLVVLIFLMLTTTYSRFTELQVNLPSANSERLRERPGEVIVSVSADGRYAINRKLIDGRSVELLALELRAAAAGRDDTVVIISADATAAHQSVVNVLDAARRAGLQRLTFATQTGANAGR